jgi:hypothetical protein
MCLAPLQRNALRLTFQKFRQLTKDFPKNPRLHALAKNFDGGARMLWHNSRIMPV